MQSYITPQQTALLQTMGIDVYKRVESLNVCECKWLLDVCDLLDINRDNVLFDSSGIHYDKTEKKLHLPALFYRSESSLKQSIWRAIQPFVQFES